MGKESKKKKESSLPAVKICVSCKHCRVRPKYDLFSTSALQAPGVLKAKTEWEQQVRQRAEQEAQRVAAGLPFDYEPHNYAWCAKLTPIKLVASASANDAEALATLMQQGGAVMSPVTGKITPIYVLCAQANPTGQCPHHEPK